MRASRRAVRARTLCAECGAVRDGGGAPKGAASRASCARAGVLDAVRVGEALHALGSDALVGVIASGKLH